MTDGLKPKQREAIIAKLSANPKVERIVLFGSRAMGTFTTTSDIDLALFGSALTLSDQAALSEEMDELPIPQRVDILVHHRIESQALREHIRKHGVEWFARKQATGTADMAGGWRNLPFTEAVLVNPQVRLERGRRYPFVDMGAVSAGARSAFATEEREFSGGGSRFQHGDTLMARITPCLENRKIARFCAPEGSGVGHGSTEFIVVRGRPGVTHSDFAYYLTLWEGVRGYAISHMTGTSGRQRVPTDCLDHLTVPIPPLAEQRAIAHILGTLDDKIELNRRMSRTLEEIARAIFKSWFVDFDPVRAKCRGEPMCSPPIGQAHRPAPTDWHWPQHILDLFPDRLVDSELGEIPEGWGVGCIEDEFDITMGQSPPGNTYNEVGEGLPFYQGRTDFGFRFPTRRVYCTSPTRLAKKGDTLISVRAPVGDINMAGEDCAIGRGIAAARHKTGSRSYTYQFMRAQADVFACFEAEGTVFGSIGKKDFHAIKCLVPPTDLITAFEQLVAPLEDRIEISDHQSRTLAALRDALLPKLISGEIRLPAALRDRAAQAGVKDAERILEERGL